MSKVIKSRRRRKVSLSLEETVKLVDRTFDPPKPARIVPSRGKMPEAVAFKFRHSQAFDGHWNYRATSDLRVIWSSRNPSLWDKFDALELTKTLRRAARKRR